MPWTALGVLGLLSLWAACGLLPWCVVLIAGRGRGAFSALPVAIVAGIAGGLVVAAIADSWLALLVSLASATLAAAAAIVAFRRVTLEFGTGDNGS